MKKWILMSCSILPLCLQMPYLHSAWRNSRLDHWDWLFYLAAIPAIGWALHKEKPARHDWWALLLLLPMLLLSLTSKIHHINALAAASSVVFLFAAAWLQSGNLYGTGACSLRHTQNQLQFPLPDNPALSDDQEFTAAAGPSAAGIQQRQSQPWRQCLYRCQRI